MLFLNELGRNPRGHACLLARQPCFNDLLPHTLLRIAPLTRLQKAGPPSHDLRRTHSSQLPSHRAHEQLTMIDFQKSAVFKLSPIPVDKTFTLIQNFIAEEQVLSAFQTARDQSVFTNKRIIAANVQGMTGKKVDYTSIPYRKIRPSLSKRRVSWTSSAN